MSATCTIQRALRFRMEPSDEQAVRLLRFTGARRWAWNWALGKRKTRYAETGEALSVTELCTSLTAYKRTDEGAWLKDIDSQLPQQAFRDLNTAFKAFFEKRSQFPRFKSRKRDRPRFRIPQRVQLRDQKVYVPGVGWVAIRKSRDPPESGARPRA